MKSNIVTFPSTLMLKITSGKAGPEYKFPEKVYSLKVYVEGPPVCVVPEEDLEANDGDIRYHQLQFYARVMKGRYRGLLVIVTRKFDPPKRNILNGVELNYGMIVEVSGNLDFHVWKGEAPIPARFDITATSVVRDEKYKEERKRHEEKQEADGKKVRPHNGRDGGFSC